MFTIAIGSLSCLGYGPLSGITVLGMAFLDFFDFATNSILMPIAAFFTCLLVGHVIGPKVIIDEVEKTGHTLRRKNVYVVMIRWVTRFLSARESIWNTLSFIKVWIKASAWA